MARCEQKYLTNNKMTGFSNSQSWDHKIDNVHIFIIIIIIIIIIIYYVGVI